MMSQETASAPGEDGVATTAFRDAYSGWLTGLLQWADVDAVMALLRARPEGWFIYDTREDVPQAPVAAADLGGRLDAIMAFLHRHHRADYCGFVYVDDRNAPRLVKVYDPRNASSCSLASPIPAFTISVMPPEALPFEGPPVGDGSGSGAVVTSSFLKRILKGRS